MLGVSDDGGAEREEAKARIRAAEAALARLEELLEEGAVHARTRPSACGARSASGATASGAAFDDGTTGRSRSGRQPTSA